MSDGGIGGVATAAVNLTEYILGSQTKTSGSGTTVTDQHANTTVTSMSDTATNSTTNTATSGETDTKTNNTVTNSADPGVIAMLKQLASTAIANSTDSAKTTGLLSGILQTAGDAMTAVFGQQKQAGVYNSSATTSQTNDILSRAGALAAQAILGYQTTEQQLAGSIGKNLLDATGTQTTIGDVDTKTNSLSSTVANTNTHTSDTATTAVTGGSTSNNVSSSTSKTSSGISVVCTWMWQNKLLGTKRYYVSSDDLDRKPSYIRNGYLVSARPLIFILKRDHTTRISRGIIAIFSARTEYVCASRGLKGCKKTKFGAFSRALIATYITPVSLFFYFHYLLRLLLLRLLDNQANRVVWKV